MSGLYPDELYAGTQTSELLSSEITLLIYQWMNVSALIYGHALVGSVKISDVCGQIIFLYRVTQLTLRDITKTSRETVHLHVSSLK